MKKSFPWFGRIASVICIAISSVACEKFDDTNPFDYKPLPKPLPDMILYTTSDGAPVNVDKWKNDILDNCYYDGMGRIILKEGVTEIHYEAFSGCSTLLDVALPENITVIGYGAFSSSRLRSIVIPDTVVSLKDFAFSSCRDLVSITIPDSVTSMGEGVFSICRNLYNVKLSKNLTSIPRNAFYWSMPTTRRSRPPMRPCPKPVTRSTTPGR